MAYYVVPDIHGNFKGLVQALEKIMADFKPEKDKIVFLGDYVDRGENGFSVLTTLFNLQKKYGEDTVICIKGNHDEMFLDFLRNPYIVNSLGNDWELNNVKSFIGDYFSLSDLSLSYECRIVDLNSGKDKTKSVADYIKKEHKELIDWYRNLPMYYDKTEEDNVLFIHAGIEENVLGDTWKYYTTKEQMTWKYPATYGNNPYGFDIVSGHIIVDEFWKFQKEPCYDIYKSGNHYYVDGGSPINPKLNILKIQDGKYFDFNSGKELL